jgi:uncharacterized protein (TIGR03067 family)
MRGKGLLCVAIVLFLLAPVAADDKDKDKDKAKLDPAKLVGTWTYVSGVKNGEKTDAEMLKKGMVIITKDTLTLKTDAGDFIIKYSVDTKKSPAQISLEITEGPQGAGSKATGIISLKEDELKLCYPAMGGETPKNFESKEGSGNNFFVLKRKK